MKTKRKNIFKSLLALTLALIMVLGVAPINELVGVDWASLFAPKAEAADDTVYGDGDYSYTVSNGAATIRGCNEKLSGDIILPSKLGGYPVQGVANYAFDKCEDVTSITIGESITEIEPLAFISFGIESITVSSNNPVYMSKDGVLYKGEMRELIRYPIGNKRSSFVIPDGVDTIASFAFYGSVNLTSITISDSVTNIGDSAFLCCRNLKSITIPDSVTSIGDCAFGDCTDLTSITIVDGVTSIGNEAFSGCYSLTRITIPDSVKSIGAGAFSGCSSLTNITIPDSVTSIGDGTFYYCIGLTSITIPDSVTNIGDEVFNGCNKLTSITIPDSVTSMGEGVFNGCDKLTNITIPDSVTNIGAYAFSGCSSLASITIPDSVIRIERYSFYNCTSLTSITIPDSVTRIYGSAFESCKSLKDVYYTGSEVQWKAIISIGGNNEDLFNATIHYNWTGEHVCKNKKLVTIPAQCEVNGMSYYICTECGKQMGEATVIPATGHSWGEWKVTKAATTSSEGSRERVCSVCSKKETEVIPVLAQTVKDDKSGIEISAPSGSYDGELELEVEEIFDGESFQIVSAIDGQEQSKIYDVTTKVNGKETQPGSTVTVRIPLPEGYDPARTYVYHVNSETGEVENMNARYEDGCLVFETDHFSAYAVVQIKAPKKDSIFKKILNVILAPFRAIINLFKKLFGK